MIARIASAMAPLAAFVVIAPHAVASSPPPLPPRPPAPAPAPAPRVDQNCCTQDSPDAKNMTWNGQDWVCPNGQSC